MGSCGRRRARGTVCGRSERGAVDGRAGGSCSSASAALSVGSRLPTCSTLGQPRPHQECSDGLGRESQCVNSAVRASTTFHGRATAGNDTGYRCDAPVFAIQYHPQCLPGVLFTGGGGGEGHHDLSHHYVRAACTGCKCAPQFLPGSSEASASRGSGPTRDELLGGAPTHGCEATPALQTPTETRLSNTCGLDPR